MNKCLKHLVGMVAVLFLISSPALACGSKSCSSKKCTNQAGHAQSCISGENKCAMNKKGHAAELLSDKQQAKLCADMASPVNEAYRVQVDVRHQLY